MSSPFSGLTIGAALAVASIGGIAAFNYVSVGAPVSQAVSSDSRNAGLTLGAHFGSYVDPGTLVLDLSRTDAVAPIDLWRALFESAEAMHANRRRFRIVVLARAGKPVFVMKGEDFAEIGEQRSYGENPLYMIRKLPSKLYRPDGRQAYTEWSGGLLGVFGAKMQDGNAAAQQWAAGSATAY
jgi:hypothetical protein